MWIGLFIVTLLWVSSVCLMGYGFLALRRQENLLQKAYQQIQLLKKHIHHLHQGKQGVGNKIQHLEHQLRQLDSRQEEMAQQDKEMPPYAHAMKLIEKGTTVEELTQEYGLTRGEAQLMMMLYTTHE